MPLRCFLLSPRYACRIMLSHTYRAAATLRRHAAFFIIADAAFTLSITLPCHSLSMLFASAALMLFFHFSPFSPCCLMLPCYATHAFHATTSYRHALLFRCFRFSPLFDAAHFHYCHADYFFFAATFLFSPLSLFLLALSFRFAFRYASMLLLFADAFFFSLLFR